MNVSAIIVTRGDVDTWPVIESLPDEWEIVIWDNGAREKYLHHPQFHHMRTALPIASDLAVYGRYAAIEYATHDVIYVQDDDCIAPALEIAAHYEPGRLVANMPRSRWEGYPDSSLVGWGAIFDRHLPREAFGRLPLFVSEAERDWFRITCDVAFSALTRRTIIDFPFEHLPWAEGPDRMFTSRPTHSEERERMLELCRSMRGEDDDRRDW